jgi:hypothetical protein
MIVGRSLPRRSSIASRLLTNSTSVADRTLRVRVR